MSALFLSLIVFMIMGLAGLGGGGRFLDQYMTGIPGNNNSSATATATPVQIPTDTPPANISPTTPVSANCLTTPIMENFDSTALNQNLWVVAKDSNNTGKVEFFSGLMKASAGSSGTMSFAGLLTKQKACGDFDVKVTLNNFTASDGNEAVARLSVEKAKDNNPDFSNDSVVIEIFKKNAQFAIKTIHYLDENVLDQGEVDYLSANTQLRIARQNKDISAYYYQSGGWLLLKKFTNVHDADSFLFIGVKSSINNPSVSAGYDNFGVSGPSAPASTITPTNAVNISPTPSTAFSPTPTTNNSPTPSPTILACPPSSSNSYETSGVNTSQPRSLNPPAAQHPDINLAVRGYVPASGTKTLVDISGPTDNKAPQLSTILGRAPVITYLYKVYDWNWSSNTKGGLINDPEVTMFALNSTPGENIRVPNSAYRIDGDYQVLVLYATQNSITIKYTPDDNVIDGYTVHMDGFCTDPNLLTLYQQNSSVRDSLPALRGNQILGTANNSEVKVVIRDKGAFMDPRSRKDWWQGY